MTEFVRLVNGFARHLFNNHGFIASFVVHSAMPLRRWLGGHPTLADLSHHTFRRDTLSTEPGDVPWDDGLERLVVNRLLTPRSELFA